MSSRLCPYCMRMSENEICPHCGKNINYTGFPAHLPAGYVVNGKHSYVLGAALGQGGFGITYVALDMVTGERVAIKEYYPTYCSARTSDSYVTAYTNQEEVYLKGKERFLDEARTLKSLSDLKNIVNVLDFFEANNSAYLVMEFLEGKSLKEYAAEHGRFPVQKFLQQIEPLMEDIHRMHERGVIHRDIAPENIILMSNGRMKLIDFGAARSYLGDKSMTVVVKKGFAPLEQYLSKGVTASTDVYAIAATIYYCITGNVPIDSAQRHDESMQIPMPSALGITINKTQEQALASALELQQKNRTQSVQTFLEQLHGIQPPRPLPPVPDPWRKKRRILAAVAAVLACVLVLFFSFRDIAGNSQDGTVFAPEHTETSREPWRKNILMATVFTEEYAENSQIMPVFHGAITRNMVTSVTFLDSLDEEGPGSWDVSEAQDDSVKAWVVEGEDTCDLYIAAEGGINGKNCTNLFRSYVNTVSIDFNDCFHTDEAESMWCMFYECTSLTDLNLSGLKTDNVREMSYLFSGAESLSALDLSGFDTSNVESMVQMFNCCTSLTSLNIDNFDTSKVTTMAQMFFDVPLKKLDLSHFDTSSVTDMSWMFSQMESLQELNVSSFDTSNVTDMSSMFFGTGLANLDLSHFDTSSVTNMSWMFCDSNFISLDLSHFVTSNVKDMSWMFNNCEDLQTLNIEGWDVSAVDDWICFADNNIKINGQHWEILFQ